VSLSLYMLTRKKSPFDVLCGLLAEYSKPGDDCVELLEQCRAGDIYD